MRFRADVFSVAYRLMLAQWRLVRGGKGGPASPKLSWILIYYKWRLLFHTYQTSQVEA